MKADAQPIYEILKSETERVARIVRQMLGLYRNNEQVKPVNVNTLVEDTVLLLNRQLQRSNIEVKTKLGDLPDAVVAADQLLSAEGGGDFLGQRHRVLLRLPGQHHRRVGGEVAMRRVARRLDRDAVEVDSRWQRPRGHHLVERGKNQPAEIAENIAHRLFVIPTRRYRTTGDARRVRIGRSCRRGNRR